MKFKKLFSNRSKKNRSKNLHANRSGWGRISRMETLEDRRVLANYYVLGNSDSIQDAVNDAANNPGPDTVFLTSDTYRQQVEINDNHPLTIVGLGNVVLRDSNQFSGNIISIYDSNHVTLKNLTVRDADDDNVDVERTYKIELYNVELKNADDDGVDAEDVDYFYAYNSKFNNNDDNGIELRNVGYAYLREVQANYNGEDNGDSDVNYNGVSYINGDNNWDAVAALEENGSSNGPSGILEIFSGDFSKNESDGIHTEGVEIVDIDTIYANDNYEDGLDVEDGSYDAEELHINYAAFDANGDDGVESNADKVYITEIRALHNDDEGLDVDAGEELHIYNSDFSNNGEDGLDIDNIEIIDIDYIQANYNGGNPDGGGTPHGLNIDNVDNLKVNNSQFIDNEGDGIDVFLNEYGQAEFTWVDSSYNDGNGIDLSGFGTANLDGINTAFNDRNGIKSSGLYALYINNTSSTYNDRNGLYIDGNSQSIIQVESAGSGGSSNGFFNGTDVQISWSEFANNYEDGIHAENAGSILLDRISATFNGDDGFESINPYVPATVIDSIFEYNFDEDFDEVFNP